MNIRFLDAFLWVARLGSFKLAADRLCTTQAGISGRIAKLEEQFGVRLFERDSRAVTLTFAGSELLPYAERIVELQGRMLAAVKEKDDFKGVLRIGAIETVVHTWLSDLLQRFARHYPKVTLDLVSDTTPHLREELLRGTIDCAFLAESISQGFIENHLLTEYPVRWVASPALAAKLPSGTLGLADIGAHPIISFSRDSSIYRNIVQVGNVATTLRVSYFSSLAAMVQLTRGGYGLSPLPLAVLGDDLAAGRLVQLETDPAPLGLPIVLSLRGDPPSPLADALIEQSTLACLAFRGLGSQ